MLSLDRHGKRRPAPILQLIFPIMIPAGGLLAAPALAGTDAAAKADHAATEHTATGHDATTGHGATEISLCDLIASAAQKQALPTAFLTRLIWRESSFRPSVVSPAGAEGIAQFMPMTAGERGLADPFDPQAAIPKAAELLADLARRFGNLGLAAAAYNAGPGRVGNWLAGHGGLPAETRAYVFTVTKHPVEDWIGGAAAKAEAGLQQDDGKASRAACLTAAADIRITHPQTFATSAFIAPWGVQIAGSFNKAAAMASFQRTKVQYAAILGSGAPMVVTTPSLGPGMRTYYRIRMPAATRGAANTLCTRLEHLGGACAVLRN